MAKNKETMFEHEISRRIEGVTVSSAADMEYPITNSTGSFNLDFDLASPFPERSVVEIFGSESSFKTTVGLSAIGHGLMADKHCAFINMEKSLNRNHIESTAVLRPFLTGPKKDLFTIINCTGGEKAFNAMKLFAEQYPRSIILLDSIDACVPEALLSLDIGEVKVGNHAKLMSDALRKLIDTAYQTRATLIFINQLRSKIIAYGNPNETTGGRAIKFYAHQRIELMKPGKDQILTDTDGNVIGSILRYTIRKNKYQPAEIEGEIPLLYGYGIFNGLELVDMCLKFGILPFGGKGGKQAAIPKWNSDRTDFLKSKDGEIERSTMSRLNAGRLLTMDQKLFDYLHSELNKILSISRKNDFLSEEPINEVSES